MADDRSVDDRMADVRLLPVYMKLAQEYGNRCMAAQKSMGADVLFAFRRRLTKGAEGAESHCGSEWEDTSLRFLSLTEIATVVLFRNKKTRMRSESACIANKLAEAENLTLSPLMQEKARAFLHRYEYSSNGAVSTHQAAHHALECGEIIRRFNDTQLTDLISERYGTTAVRYLTATTGLDWDSTIGVLSSTKQNAIERMLAPLYGLYGQRKHYDTAFGRHMTRHVAGFLVHNFIAPALDIQHEHVIDVGDVYDPEDSIIIATTELPDKNLTDLIARAQLLISFHSEGNAPRIHGVAHYTPDETSDDHLLDVQYPTPFIHSEAVADNEPEPPCWGAPGFTPAISVDDTHEDRLKRFEDAVATMNHQNTCAISVSVLKDRARFTCNTSFDLTFGDVAARYFGFLQHDVSSTETMEGTHEIAGDYAPGHHLSTKAAAHERIADQYLRWWQSSRWCSDDVNQKWITRTERGDLLPLWKPPPPPRRSDRLAGT